MNLDQTLDDIIDQDRRSRHGRRQGRSDRGSPYSRSSSRQSQGKWKHDQFDGPKSINDRLGGSSKPSRAADINSRLGNDSKPQSRPKEGKTSHERVISIAGTHRDETPYEEKRVVWVVNIPNDYTEERIKSMFGDVGRVDEVRMAIDKDGLFAGKAELLYRKAADARSAIQTFDGEGLISVNHARIRKLVIGYSSTEQANYIDRLKNFSATPNRQRRQQQGNRSQDSRGRDSRPTTEQLDAELDAYMDEAQS